jgi:hypothetical protein
MKKLFYVALAIAALTVGCSNTSDVQAIKKTVADLQVALSKADIDGVTKIAPFIAGNPPETVSAIVAKLGEILGSSTDSSVEILDRKTANVVLRGRNPITIPFTKTPAGNWIIADTFTRKQFIEVVPLK